MVRRCAVEMPADEYDRLRAALSDGENKNRHGEAVTDIIKHACPDYVLSGDPALTVWQFEPHTEGQD